jgi:hypothetical protein
MCVTVNFETPERKRAFGRPRHEQGNNIKMDLKELVWEDVE